MDSFPPGHAPHPAGSGTAAPLRPVPTRSGAPAPDDSAPAPADVTAPAEPRAEPTDAPAPDDAFRAVLCGDGLRRCPWAPTAPASLEEHDVRWGNPPENSPAAFEALSLEIFQAGLARWSIAQRRDGLRRALRGFVPEEIARMTEDAVDEMLLDPAVIRNRAKITAVVHNARACVGMGPDDWAQEIEDLRPARAQPPHTVLALPRHSPEGDRLAARLKARGLVFVGRATAHQFLLRTGVLPGHLAECFRARMAPSGSEATDVAAGHGHFGGQTFVQP